MNFMNIQHSTFNIQHRRRGLWFVRSLAGLFAAGMALSVSSGAQETNSYPPLNSFQIIGTKNIFNPNRYRQDNRTNETVRSRVDAFALVGTMSYSKGKFAFFDGSNTQYKKVLEPGGNIAGYTVKDITQTNVTLSANGKDFGMPIASQMRKQADNKWQLSGHIIEEVAADQTNGETNGESAAVESSTPSGGSPEMSDVLKKMAERRKQELQ
jgi:hypothetical protein